MFKAIKESFKASKHLFDYKVLLGGAAALAGVGIIAKSARNNQIQQSEQGIQAAQQQIQGAQMQAAMAMQQAQAGGMMPNSAAPQIMGSSAQHMGMMDAAPELARG